MKRERLWIGSVVLFALASSVAAAGAGCVSSDNNAPPAEPDAAVPAVDGASPGIDATTPDGNVPPMPDAGSDTSVEQPDVVVPADATPDAADAAEASVPQATIRFGWFVSASVVGGMPRGLAVKPAGVGAKGVADVCVAPHGTGLWQGPLLAASGLAGGLPPLSVTSGFSVVPGQYDVRVIPPGSTSCDVADAGAGDAGGPTSLDYTNLPALTPNESVTVVIVDTPSDAGPPPPPSAIALVDETTTTSGKTKLRVVNTAALLGQSVTFGLGGGVAFEPLFVNVPPGIDPGADTNGYREISEVLGIDTTLLATGAPNGSLSSSAYPLTAGSIHTVFAAYNGAVAELLVCADGTSTVAGLTDCTLTTSPSQSDQAYTRFGNFIADVSAPAVDVCIKYHALSSYAGPLLANGTGLVPPANGAASAVSGYFNVHGGFTYDVRLVAADSSDCSTSIADGTYTAPVVDTTLAAVGYLTVPADAGAPVGPVDAGPEAGAPGGGLSSLALAFQPFAGDESSSSLASCRTVNLATLRAQPFDISGGSIAFSDIPYGGLATFPQAVDSSGYANLTFRNMSFSVVDTIGGGNEANDFVNFATGSANTLFIYSFVNGPSTNVNVMSCDDKRVLGGMATCQILNGG